MPVALVLLYLPVLLLVAGLLLVSVVLSLPWQRLRERRETEQRRTGRRLNRFEYLFAESVDGPSTCYGVGSFIRGLFYLVLWPVGRLATSFAGFLIETFGSYD